MNHNEFFVAVSPNSLVNWLAALPFPVRLRIHNVGKVSQNLYHGYVQLIIQACLIERVKIFAIHHLSAGLVMVPKGRKEVLIVFPIES